MIQALIPDVAANAVKLVVVAVAVAVLLRVRVPRAAQLAVGAVGLVTFVFHAELYGSGPADLKLFWKAGQAVRDGTNPYADELIVSTPNALPFFAAASVIPLPVMVVVWFVASVALGLGLVALAAFALHRLGEPRPVAWAGPLVLFSAVVALSFATRFGIGIGQLSVLTTAAAFLAVACRDRPGVAGLGLVVAHLKATTGLPVLLLFLRPRDWRAWAVLAVVGTGLTLLACPPAVLPERVAACLRNIKALGESGRVNDPSYANEQSAQIVGFDHLLYRLGVRDPLALRVGGVAAVAALGVGLGYFVYRRRRPLSPAAAAAAGAVFACLFLYHRLYDLVLLALPLAFAVGRALASDRGWSRRLYQLAGLVLIAALYTQVGVLQGLTDRFAGREDVVARVVQGVVLPAPTWLLLAALGVLVAADLRDRRLRADDSAPMVPPVVTNPPPGRR